MRCPLPAKIAVQIRPVPDEFSPHFEECDGYVQWTSTFMIDGHGPLNVQLGFSLAPNKANRSAEEKNLRASAWQAMELARLKRMDLLSYCVVDRHSPQGRQRVAQERKRG